ncbi:MAG: hypothetical protein MJ180_05520 [Candidatus Gastranaerophilales bacterium]|nr:hypothetical protein [Candidatus Gastranaerophilales bacterium]
MLPIITEEHKSTVFTAILDDIHSWRKSMIHYIKDENPEINQAIVDIASNTDLDPKAVALGAYMVYKMLEIAEAEQGSVVEQFLE